MDESTAPEAAEPSSVVASAEDASALEVATIEESAMEADVVEPSSVEADAIEASVEPTSSVWSAGPSSQDAFPLPSAREEDALWMVPDAAAPPAAEDAEGEAYWTQPDVVAKLERMRALGEKAKLNATTRREKRLLEEYYTEEGLRRRIRLLSHPEVVRALETIWKATDSDGNHKIDKEEYKVMHRKLVLALDPTTPPKDAFEAADEDWIKDSDGKRYMNKERFYWCWFELADLWTDSLEPQAYVDFLIGTMKIVTRKEPWGIDWASDRAVRVRRVSDPAETAWPCGWHYARWQCYHPTTAALLPLDHH